MKKNKVVALMSIGVLIVSLVNGPIVIQAVETTSDSQTQNDDTRQPIQQVNSFLGSQLLTYKKAQQKMMRRLSLQQHSIHLT